MAALMNELFDLLGLNYVPATLQEFFPYFMKCMVGFFIVIFLIDMIYSIFRVINKGF